MNNANKRRKKIFNINFLKYFLLPVLVTVYPTVFLYANNVHDLLLIHLCRTVLVYFLIATIAYLFFLVFYRWVPLKAANSAFVFLVYFNLYGIFEKFFFKLDWFPVRFYTTLPLVLLLVSYTIWLLNKLSKKIALRIWNFSILILAGLLIFNFANIIPSEIIKKQNLNNHSINTAKTNLSDKQRIADIYYIVLDEFSGFTAMRDYWHNSKVDDFYNYLKSKGFVIYENSHGSSTDTVHQLATRLNYEFYQSENSSSEQNQWFNDIADNKVMGYLKSVGYTTITFEEMQYIYPASKPITSDVSYTYNNIPATNLGVYFDDFWILVADNTMLKELSIYYRRIGSDQHSNMVFFTANKIGNLDDQPSPKFVYSHLIFPHAPFIFDEKGHFNTPKVYYDYNYYIGQYNFSIDLIEKMVNSILDNSDPANPPVIILQSDHGLRNFTDGFINQLVNFPEHFKTNILYARLMPGYLATYSEQEIDPINTFPIVFNYLFGTNIPLK